MALALASALPTGFISLPFLPKPSYLDGALAADSGFDPLRLAKTALPGAPGTTERRIMWYREAEVKHARLAMLAAAGWPASELWHGQFSKTFGLPYALDGTQGRCLSILNGHLGDVWPFLLLVTLATSWLEISTLDQVYGLTRTGVTMGADGKTKEMKSYVPGDCGFDPLGLYGFYGGGQVPAMVQMKAEVDPMYAMEWATYNRKEMETAEIQNGRLAMLAITGFAVQEAMTGMPVVDQTPIFFTPLLEVLAPGALGSITMAF